MVMLKNCLNCRKIFRTHNRDMRCCSPKCTSKIKRIQATESRIFESWAIGDEPGISYWHGESGRKDLNKKNLKYWNRIKKKKKPLKEALYYEIANNIYDEGRNNPHFDFEKGLNDLIKQQKKGEADWYILLAGKYWKRFNYKKGLQALKDMKSLYLYNVANEWPLGIEETRQANQKIKSQAHKMEKKPFGMKEGYQDMEADGISYWNSPDWKFDTDPKALKYWNSLKKKKKKPLKENFYDQDPYEIYWAGADATAKNSQSFDFKEASDRLIKYDTTGKFIYLAGKGWKWFDYVKGLETLEKISKEQRSKGGSSGVYFLHLAADNWPRNAEVIKQQTQDMKSKSTKMPKEPFGLKEDAQSDKTIRDRISKDYSKVHAVIERAVKSGKEIFTDKKLGFMESDSDKKINLVVFHLEKILDLPRPVDLAFSVRNPDFSGGYGLITGGTGKGKAAIALNIFPESRMKEADPDTWNGEVQDNLLQAYESHQDVFFHEFIHYWDSLRHKAGFEKFIHSSSSSAKGEKAYANEPSEYNAYYQEMVVKADRIAEKMIDRPREMLKRLYPDFDTFYKKFTKENTTFHLYSKDTIRRLTKRMYQYYQKYVEGAPIKEDLWSLGTDRSPTHAGLSYWSDSDSKMDNHFDFKKRVKQLVKKKKPKKIIEATSRPDPKHYKMKTVPMGSELRELTCPNCKKTGTIKFNAHPHAQGYKDYEHLTCKYCKSRFTVKE